MPYKDPKTAKEYQQKWRLTHIALVRERGRIAKRKERATWSRKRKDMRNEWEAQYRLKNIERVRKYHRIYSQKWRKRRPHLAKAAELKWRHKNPDKMSVIQRRRALKSRYSLTPTDYEKMLSAQNSVCAICKISKEGSRGKRLFVDHSHATGKIRGLLCHRCNTALGCMKDNAERLREAAHYLDTHEK